MPSARHAFAHAALAGKTLPGNADPFHDIKLYHMAPLYLLRGELFDSMTPEHYPARVRRRIRLKR